MQTACCETLRNLKNGKCCRHTSDPETKAETNVNAQSPWNLLTHYLQTKCFPKLGKWNSAWVLLVGSVHPFRIKHLFPVISHRSPRWQPPFLSLHQLSPVKLGWLELPILLHSPCYLLKWLLLSKCVSIWVMAWHIYGRCALHTCLNRVAVKIVSVRQRLGHWIVNCLQKWHDLPSDTVPSNVGSSMCQVTEVCWWYHSTRICGGGEASEPRASSAQNLPNPTAPSRNLGRRIEFRVTKKIARSKKDSQSMDLDPRFQTNLLAQQEPIPSRLSHLLGGIIEKLRGRLSQNMLPHDVKSLKWQRASKPKSWQEITATVKIQKFRTCSTSNRFKPYLNQYLNHWWVAITSWSSLWVLAQVTRYWWRDWNFEGAWKLFKHFLLQQALLATKNLKWTSLSRFCLAEFSGAGSLFRLLLVGRAEDTLSLKSSTFSTKGMASLHKMLGLVNPSATIKLLTIMRHASKNGKSKNGKCKWNIGRTVWCLGLSNSLVLSARSVLSSVQVLLCFEKEAGAGKSQTFTLSHISLSCYLPTTYLSLPPICQPISRSPGNLPLCLAPSKCIKWTPPSSPKNSFFLRFWKETWHLVGSIFRGEPKWKIGSRSTLLSMSWSLCFTKEKGKRKFFCQTSEKLVGKLNVDMFRLDTFSGCMTLEKPSPVHALLFQTPSSSLIVCFFSSCICTCCVYLSLPLPLSSQLSIHLSTSASLHVAHWPSLFPCNSFFSSSVSVSLSVLLPITISLLDIYEADSLCLCLDLLFKLFLKIKGSSHVPSLKRKVWGPWPFVFGMSHVSYLASGHSFPSEHTATSTLASTRRSAGIVITVHAWADTHTQ